MTSPVCMKSREELDELKIIVRYFFKYYFSVNKLNNVCLVALHSRSIQYLQGISKDSLHFVASLEDQRKCEGEEYFGGSLRSSFD